MLTQVLPTRLTFVVREPTRVFVTYFDRQYLLRGIALYQSLMRHAKGFRLIVLALDKYVEDAVRGLPNVELMRLSDLPKDVLAWRASRSYTEFCWTISPFSVAWGLKEYDAVTYIDSDCFLFAPLEEIYREIGRDSVAITPHRFDAEHKWREEVNGVYNVGLVFFCNDNAARACLRNWEEQCSVGKNDQVGWNDLVPRYNVHVIQNIGASIAPWNFSRHTYRSDGDAVWVSDGTREDMLVMFHAHETQHDEEGNITRTTNWKIPEFVVDNVYSQYQKALYDARRFLG